MAQQTAPAKHGHQHGPECGHVQIKHDGHVDYLHDGAFAIRKMAA